MDVDVDVDVVVVVPVSEVDDVRGPVVDDDEEDEDEEDEESEEDDSEDEDEAEEFEVLVVICTSLKQAQSAVATIPDRVNEVRRGLGVSAGMV